MIIDFDDNINVSPEVCAVSSEPQDSICKSAVTASGIIMGWVRSDNVALLLCASFIQNLNKFCFPCFE